LYALVVIGEACIVRSYLTGRKFIDPPDAPLPTGNSPLLSF
jgi:hypothetical protein